MPELTVSLPDAEATARLGAAIAPLLGPGEALLLYGPLGMGKSTLARGLIRALTTPDEDVPSPTFTLVQFYESDPPVAHFDLYRLVDPEELEFLGIRDYFEGSALCLIEWPQRGEGVLPKPDLTITISPQAGGRSLNLSPQGARGEAWCVALASIIYFSWLKDAAVLHAWLIPILLSITVPVTTLLLARAALFRKRMAKEPVPEEVSSGRDRGN